MYFLCCGCLHHQIEYDTPTMSQLMYKEALLPFYNYYYYYYYTIIIIIDKAGGRIFF